MKKVLAPVLLISMICGTVSLSTAQYIDSVKAILKQKPVFFIDADGNNSFVSVRLVNTFGIRAGISYDDKIKFGMGYTWLISKIERNEIINFGDRVDTIKARLKFAYFSPSVEYLFLNKDPWMLSVQMLLGLGSSCFKYSPPRHILYKRFNMFYEPSLIGQYKINKWVGLGFGAGFRFMLIPNKAINQNFNSPVYSLYIKLFPEEIYKSVFPDGKLFNNSN